MKNIFTYILFLCVFQLSSQSIVMQNGNFTVCSGTFYDSGGPGGNYSNNENFIITFCPDTAGEVVYLNFLSFFTQPNFDVLTIYDGNGIAAPVIGDFSGNEPIGLITGSIVNATGCLTLRFVSNNAVTQAGWEATISCGPPPCQSIIANFLGAACEDELGSGEGTFDLTELSEEILSGQLPPEYEISYHESEEDASLGENAIVTPESYISTGGTIWARVTRVDPDFGEECYEIVPIELVVNPLPIIVDLLESYRLCVDAEGNPIMEDFGMTSPPMIDTGLSTPEYFFIWEIDGVVQLGETQGSIIATVGGTYTVTVINAQTGCESQASTTVTESSPPITYSAQAATAAFAGVHAIEATAEGLGDYIFRLDDGPYQDEGFWDNVSPGTHIVTITDRNGCGSVEIEVTIIDYPLFFTPNNDGYHDTWNIVGISSIPTAKIYIFNRHGKLLKQISPMTSGWDGTYNGRALPSSDYWFRVVYLEDEREKEFTGHFTLKR